MNAFCRIAGGFEMRDKEGVKSGVEKELGTSMIVGVYLDIF